ncbi:hypothetical protein GCM10010503_10780 [Streptomyces lucensis JCM 4490]|uniref:PrsW family intramembrane metalloprotease n=1 Tax=Streptomyces lucensis JCM 4490 TaxID=1306176 RepID=A0A918J068_9ACTN|nr:PrsW family glutamic-type intramembrane protease [Streptomyces lucensis]GGW36716.1 hypothetical protein GCM10010503_10780 [Streptomyces lucensis JCM 4490]
MTHSPPPGRPRARIPGPQQPPPPYPRIRANLWRHGLAGGLVVWALTACLAYATRSTAPLPALILLGGFLVPVVFVLWAYERHARDLGVSPILGCFLTGAALGLPGAAPLESYLPHPSLGALFTVALAGEAAKLGALVFALRRQPGLRGTRAGLVLGACVGLGFAAPESIGYAVTAVSTAGHDLRTLLETELPRGVLTPFGHGLWTAIAGGALLSLRRLDGRFRFAPPVAAAWMGVGLLHTLWDSTHGVALRMAARLSGTGLGSRLFAPAPPARPEAAQQHLSALFSAAGLVLVTLAGLGWLRSLTRRNPPWRNTP